MFCGLNVMLVALLVGYSWARIVGLGTAGILSSGLIWLLSCDLVAWRAGGYERDTKTSRRPGARAGIRPQDCYMRGCLMA